LTVRHQAWLWSGGYLLFIALCLTISLRLPARAAEESVVVAQISSDSERPRPARYISWLAFSTCSSLILLSSTNFLCENISGIPLLWLLPLSLYLLSFILAFDSARWYSRRIFWPLYAGAVGIAVSPHGTVYHATPLLLIVLYCFTIFAVCMVCHGELARSRPSA